MGDRLRLMVTGIVAAGAVAVTVSGHGLWSMFHINDDEQETSVPLTQLKDFDGITLSGPDDVVITPGANFSVTTEGSRDVVKYLNLYVRDGVLHVDRYHRQGWNETHRNATVHVTMPGLTRVWIEGSGEVQADRVEGKEFNSVVQGSGHLRIEEVASAAVNLSVRGSGQVALGGNTGKLSVTLLGSGSVVADELQAQTADINVAGSGQVSAHAAGPTKLVVTGSGSAQVAGTNQCQITKTGSGAAECTS